MVNFVAFQKGTDWAESEWSLATDTWLKCQTMLAPTSTQEVLSLVLLSHGAGQTVIGPAD